MSEKYTHRDQKYQKTHKGNNTHIYIHIKRVLNSLYDIKRTYIHIH